MHIRFFAFTALLCASGLRAQDPAPLSGGQPGVSADAGAYDWGLVRAYFTGGMILSKGGGDFSQRDAFLGFNLDKTWRYRPSGPLANLMVSSFLETRLTSIPVAAVSGTGFASHPAALIQMGVYLPVITTEWTLRGQGHNALFVAPLVKAGLQSAGEPQPATGGTSFQGYGARLGHFAGCGDENAAPETVSYLDLVLGRWGNAGQPYRWGLEGRLRVPATPLMLGFDAMAGQGSNDLRFLFGTRFDVGKLMEKLRAAAE